LSSAHDVPPTVNLLPLPRALDAAPAIATASIGTDKDDVAEAPPARPSWREVLCVSLLPPLLTLLLVPADPLLLDGNFPWFVLVPLLVGVQHGALAATLSAALLLGVGVLHPLITGQLQALPALGAFAGGCLATGVIAGYSHDRVQARLVRSSQQAADNARRLARLSRAHAVVKLSHQRLEERLCAGNWSLVNAFEETRRELHGATSLSLVGEVVLNVLANHAMVQSATLLGITSVDRRGRIELEPSASIGHPPALDLEHRLVQRALATGRLVALDAESADGGAADSVLCVAPLAAASGRLLGLVLIHEMPFMAFQAENLKGLAALTALLADMLEQHFLEPRVDEQHLSLLPERGLRAVATPGLEPPESGEVERGDLDEAGPGSEDDFAGKRTGTHRRRSIAQSA
jgi:hypothetical protein